MIGSDWQSQPERGICFIYNVHVAVMYSSRMAEKLKVIPLSVNLIVEERDLPTSNLLCFHLQKNKD